MNGRILLRALLVSLLVLTVASKVRAPEGDDRRLLIGGVKQILSRHQFAFREDQGPARSLLPVAVRFDAPGCERPIEVVPIHINLQEAPVFDTILQADYGRLFAYLDQTWRVETRWGMRLTWLRHKVLSILGLGRFATMTTGLLILSPPGCLAAQGIDWSGAWDRRALARE